MLDVSVAAALASEKVKPVSESTIPTARASSRGRSGDGLAEAETCQCLHYALGLELLPKPASAAIPAEIRIFAVDVCYSAVLALQ